MYISSAITLDRPYNHSLSSSLLTIYLGTIIILTYYLIILNPNYTIDTYYNYNKIDYYLLDYLLPYTPYIKLKELRKLLELDLESDNYLISILEKDLL